MTPKPPPPEVAAPSPPAALDALRGMVDAWYAVREADKARGRLARKMGLSMVVLAVFATVGAQVQVHTTSRALRSLSRGAVTAEAAGDARQLFNSRRVKADLFELQRARISRELTEVRLRSDAREASVRERLQGRLAEYQRSTARYVAESEGYRLRAESLQGQSRAHIDHGKSLSRRANRLKDAVAWFQGGIAILALAVMLHNKWLWVWSLLAAAIAATIYVTTLVYVT